MQASTFLGLTAIGVTSWLLRLLLVLLDTLPMLFKIMHTLRLRRPYDALVAERDDGLILEAAAGWTSPVRAGR